MGHRSYEHTSRSLTHDKHVLYQKVLSASTDQFSNEHHKHHIKNTEETFFFEVELYRIIIVLHRISSISSSLNKEQGLYRTVAEKDDRNRVCW